MKTNLGGGRGQERAGGGGCSLSASDELRQAVDPGVIDTGRQWVYTLNAAGKSAELDNVAIAFDRPPRSAKGAAG